MIDLLQIVNGARGLQPNTRRSYANVIRQWLAFAGNDPENWTVATCQAFYDQLVASTSIETANVMLSGGLSYALGRAAALHPRAGIADVTRAVDRYKANQDPDDDGKRHALIAPQARKLLAACEGPSIIDLRDRAIVVLGLYTGMRRMSLVGVDLTRVRDHGAYVVLKVPIKGGAQYNVPLDARAWAQTHPYREALRQQRPAAGPMFPSFQKPRPTIDDPLGQRAVSPRAMTEDGLYRALGKRAEAAGIETFSPHIFRHTFVTWCRGEPFKIPDHLIEVVTGHKGQRGMVDKFYTDRDQLAADVARQCYEAITTRLTGGDG